jgi:hypothetical protein
MKYLFTKLFSHTYILLKIILLIIVSCVIIISYIIATSSKDKATQKALNSQISIIPEVVMDDLPRVTPMDKSNQPVNDTDVPYDLQENQELLFDNANNDNTKIDISFHDYISKYIGYIDNIVLFEDIYDNKDYDGDGLNDRIYRYFTEEINKEKVITKLINYRVDFGNGDILEIGGFEDYFIGIELIGYDLTGDSVNEIIFCGGHGGSTFPPSGSEIAVFKKTDNSYQRLPLPKPDECETENSYCTGYSFYIESILDNQITLYCPKFEYSEMITLDDTMVLDFFKLISEQEASIGSVACGVDTATFDELPALVLYINIGSRYYNKYLSVYLIWDDTEFKPVYMKLDKQPE